MAWERTGQQVKPFPSRLASHLTMTQAHVGNRSVPFNGIKPCPMSGFACLDLAHLHGYMNWLWICRGCSMLSASKLCTGVPSIFTGANIRRPDESYIQYRPRVNTQLCRCFVTKLACGHATTLLPPRPLDRQSELLQIYHAGKKTCNETTIATMPNSSSFSAHDSGPTSLLS